jgi:hypothetical protein
VIRLGSARLQKALWTSVLTAVRVNFLAARPITNGRSLVDRSMLRSSRHRESCYLLA